MTCALCHAPISESYWPAYLSDCRVSVHCHACSRPPEILSPREILEVRRDMGRSVKSFRIAQRRGEWPEDTGRRAEVAG